MSQIEIDSHLSNLRKNIDSLEKAITDSLNQLNSQNNLIPIQPIKQIYLNSCTVREYESTNYYPVKYIRFDVPKECIEKLNSQDIGISGDAVWGYYQFSYNNENSKNNFEKVINAIEVLDKTTEEENIKASTINKNTQEVVMKMLNDIGIPKSKYTYPSRRSRKKDWVTSSWVFEISSAFPSYNGNIAETKKKLIDNFNRLYKIDQDNRKAEEQKKNAEIERKESERQLAFLLAKYNLEITYDWDELLQAIIGKNKYLYLAYYLEKNRGDWNDGYSYAETGLDGFIIEDSQDQEIFNDIKNIIDTHDDVDGRYFRDCTWNYDVLFSMVKKDQPELFADYEKVVEHTNDY